MKRLFWVAAGAGAGILVVRKISAAAGRLTPEGAVGQAGERVRGLGDALRDFADEVKAGMAERDAELREALGIAPGADNDGEEPAEADLAAVHELFRTHSRGSN